MTDDIRVINNLVARKGDGKGGGGGQAAPYQPVIYPNTIRSMATARIIEVISEGIIRGPVSGWGNAGVAYQSVFFNGTRVGNADGSFNFNILEAYPKAGYPSQDPIPGFSLAEAEFAVGVEMAPYDPVVRAVSTLGINAVRVTLRFPAMLMTESDGDVNGTQVTYSVEYSIDGGGWQVAIWETLYGKTTSPYERSLHVALPYYSNNCNIRCTRQYGPPNGSIGEQNSTFWSHFTEIQYGNICYDDTAVWGFVIDAADFPNLPSRGYLIDGLMMAIPSNYNPDAHSYAGDWDGTFTFNWTNNPAWILFALLTNKRWGLGSFFDETNIDKWSFYEAAQFNDQMIYTPAGTWEPRYTCNCIINTQQDAWQVLTAIASTMNATLFYANGAVFISQDRPDSVTRLFGPADIEDGLFEYTGTDYRSRFNAVAVTWNDPDDSYNPAVELVMDHDLLGKQGYRESQQPAFACTSRWQAIRYGRWLMYTSQYLTEIVSFTVGLENADLRPGEIIQTSDPSIVGWRIAGRLLADNSPDMVTVDDGTPFFEVGGPWTLSINAGSAATPDLGKALLSFPVVEIIWPNRLRIAGKPSWLQVTGAGTMWVASSQHVVPRKWRVLGVADKGAAKYAVTASQYLDEKWAYVDYAVNIQPPPFSLLPKGPLVGPTNLTFKEYIYLDGSGWPAFGVLLSWTASTDPRVSNYQVELSGPGGDYRRFPLVTGVSLEVVAMKQGAWLETITAFDNIGRRAAPVQLSFTPIGLSAKPLPPSGLYITPQGGNLSTLTWTPTGEIDVVFYWVKWSNKISSVTWDRAVTSIARVDRNTTQVSTPTRAGTFMVKSIDSLGQESDDWAEAILEPQQTETSIFFNEAQQPGWAGDLGTNWHLNEGELWMRPPNVPETVPPGVFPGERASALNSAPTRVGVYGFDAGFDLGASTLVTMTGIVDAYGTHQSDLATGPGFMVDWVPLAIADPLAVAGISYSMATWIPLATAVPLAMGASAEWDGHIEARVSMDGTTWQPWFPLKSTIITGRAFEWRLVGTLYDLSTIMRVVEASVIVEVPLRSVAGSDAPLDGTGHLVITYAAPFLQTPTVQLTARQSLAPGGNIVITESDRDHFKVENRDASGAPHAGGSIDYFVQGYGGHS